jgi:plastocyanin
MTTLRKGDIVTFRAVVTDVADYDRGEQQIQAKILPKGESIGWCLQNENAFTIAETTLRVGDRVKFIDRPGHVDAWEIKAIFDNDQIAVQKVGNWPVEMANAKNARRL